MSRRHSVVLAELSSKIREAMAQHRQLRLCDSPHINIPQLIELTFGDSQRALDKAVRAMPPAVGCVFAYDSNDLVSLNIPIPGQGLRMPAIANGVLSGTGKDDTLLTLGAWDDMHGAAINTGGATRTLSLWVTCPKHVPVQNQWRNSDGCNVSGSHDGIVLSPAIVGDALFAKLVAEAEKFTAMIQKLNYLEHFGLATARMCTTEGITKRLWPECATFLTGSIKTNVEAAKPSGYPLAARRQFTDDTKYQEHRSGGVTKAYFHAQLKVVTDLILQAQLMPDSDHIAPRDEAGKQIPYLIDGSACRIMESYLPADLK